MCCYTSVILGETNLPEKFDHSRPAVQCHSRSLELTVIERLPMIYVSDSCAFIYRYNARMWLMDWFAVIITVKLLIQAGSQRSRICTKSRGCRSLVTIEARGCMLEVLRCISLCMHCTLTRNKQEAQLMLTTGSTRLAVSRGQQTWYHSTCYI